MKRGEPPPLPETPVVWTPDKRSRLAEACADDWPRLMYDGYGIWLTDQQIEAHALLGGPGPRVAVTDPKFLWLLGGQRSGKTVEVAGWHIDAGLYKRGVDPTDRPFWRNYIYRTLAVAPTDALAMRLYAILMEIGKGTSDAQFDRKARRSRGGAFIGRYYKVSKDKYGGLVLFNNNAEINFRSTEGRAYRLEGGQWWFITWDEWASQPDAEIEFVRTDVLEGRARDHDAKIVPLAWPKAETEHHVVRVIREIENGIDRDSKVFSLDAEQAFFTNKRALATELKRKSAAQVLRTIRGIPAGGAGIEFKEWMIDNMVDDALHYPVLREPGYDYLTTADIGLAHDATVITTFRIPVINGHRVVTPEFRARVVNWTEIPGGPSLTPDTITFTIAREQAVYGSIVAVDATSMGGMMAARELRGLQPRPHEFVARANDRIHGNMRLAAITNGLDLLTWGRPNDLDPDEEFDQPWGLIEMPRIQPLLDQMMAFDRDDKKKADDRVWSFLIGCWYIRRWWARGDPHAYQPIPFNIADEGPTPEYTGRRRSRLLRAGFAIDETPPNEGIVYIKDGKRWEPPARS